MRSNKSLRCLCYSSLSSRMVTISNEDRHQGCPALLPYCCLRSVQKNVHTLHRNINVFFGHLIHSIACYNLVAGQTQPKCFFCALQEEPLLPPNSAQPYDTGDYAELQGRIRFAMIASLIANVLLLAAKIVAFVLSQSKSVLASAADSFVDIASQV